MRNCPACGYPNPEDRTGCFKCGTSLNTDSPAPEPEPNPQVVQSDSPALTEQDRARIYAEEKARADVREQLEVEKAQVQKREEAEKQKLAAENTRNGCIGCLALIAVIWFLFYALSPAPPPSAPKAEELPPKPAYVSHGSTNAPVVVTDEGMKEECIMAAQLAMGLKLKAPGSAEFPTGTEDSYVLDYGKDYFRVESWVDSQNSFGAKLRLHYSALVIRGADGNWRSWVVRTSEDR